MHPNYKFRNRVAKIVLFLLILGLWIWASTLDYQAAGGTELTCEEDEPCWDCETMGNLICGPEAVEIDPHYTG